MQFDVRVERHDIGLFDEQHKQPLPRLPRCIGVITSPSGAAIRDVLKVLRRRAPQLRVTIFPSQVQGPSAPQELREALALAIRRGDCDVLLLTGRPSRLPGIQAVFRSLLPLPPGRILPLHHYRTGGWYPFHRRGRIEDPKTTAAVGAALCSRSQGGLPGFFLRAGALRPYSTVCILGVLDNRMVIADDQVITLDELDAHRASEIAVLEIGGIEYARRQDHDFRFAGDLGRCDRPQHRLDPC